MKFKYLVKPIIISVTIVICFTFFLAWPIDTWAYSGFPLNWDNYVANTLLGGQVGHGTTTWTTPINESAFTETEFDLGWNNFGLVATNTNWTTNQYTASNTDTYINGTFFQYVYVPDNSTTTHSSGFIFTNSTDENALCFQLEAYNEDDDPPILQIHHDTGIATASLNAGEWNLIRAEWQDDKTFIYKVNGNSWSNPLDYDQVAGQQRNVDGIRFYANRYGKKPTVNYRWSTLGYIDYGEYIHTEGVYMLHTDDELGYPNIETVRQLLCYTNQQCNLWFTFSESAIGADVYAVPDRLYRQEPAFAVGATTIVEIPGQANAIVLPTYADATTTELCLYLDHEITDTLHCGIDIHYMASTTFLNGLFKNAYEDYDLDSVCNDLTAPTSTSLLLDAFSIDFWEYTLQCSTRKVWYWLMTPKPDTYRDLYNTMAELEQSFPINIYTGIKTQLDNNLSTSSAVQPNFNLPFWYPDGSTTSLGNLLDIDSFEQGQGYELFMRLYNIVVITIWALFVYYLIHRILKFRL